MFGEALGSQVLRRRLHQNSPVTLIVWVSVPDPSGGRSSLKEGLYLIWLFNDLASPGYPDVFRIAQIVVGLSFSLRE